jgi:hypothetical protein
MTTHGGRVGAYALWQLRDYARGPMIWTILAGFFFGVFPLLMIRLHASRAGVEVPYGQAFETFIAMLSFAGPMLAVARLVSADRAPGLTRFVFAKPIGVRWYYGQAFLVRAAASMSIVTVGGLAINAFVGSVPWAEGAAAAAIAFVLIGGVGLLLSVLTRMDSGLLIAVYLIPDVLSQILQAKPEWIWWAKPLLTIMPPMHRLDEIRRALLTHAQFPQADVVHALLYGSGCIVLGIYLVRKLPLVR